MPAKKELMKIRSEYMRMAKELHYPKKYIDRLGKAESENECILIMRSARESLK